ncbi:MULTISPECIES: hypothetical protein [Saccharibacillus]|uniref:hypothetical protein n=1 Tax=Saccharibacillus TaxID=456492 RepID=UPI001311D1FF|nr:hypothetical protein [Saccharibacillus sp. WB 17]MWJ33758.1 hypothetical protein [Saccharibacillus sp. WB 17]
MIFVILLVISAVGYSCMHFLIRSLNPTAETYVREWASFFFAALLFALCGYFYLIGSAS